MESISSYNKLKRKKSPQKRITQQYLSDQCKKIQASIRQYVSSGELRKPPELFQTYNVKCILDLWEKLNQNEKLQLLSQIRVKSAGIGDNICIFRPKKQIKEVSILLKGTLDYQINIESNKHKIQYICRPGQILSQPYIQSQVQFKPFSLVATSHCFFLNFPYNSFLRQNLWEKRQARISQLLQTLSSYNELNNRQANFLKLIPYFSDCFNRRNQTILSQTQSGYFSYIFEGQIQIVKQSSKIKPVSLITMGAGQIYLHNPNQYQNQKNYIKCKSQTSLVYIIPQFIINFLGSPQFEECMNWKSNISKSLHSKLFSKNQKILINPLKFIRQKKSKKLKNWSKTKSNSRKQNESWDLIEHFANQMKISSSLSQIRREKQYAKSAHITKRSHFDSQTVTSLEKLKRMAEEQAHPETYQGQNLKLTNSFKPRLKNSLQKQSTILKSVPRTFTSYIKKETRNKLVKKTKYKLMRYAQGHNLYGLDDYL